MRRAYMTPTELFEGLVKEVSTNRSLTSGTAPFTLHEVAMIRAISVLLEVLEKHGNNGSAFSGGGELAGNHEVQLALGKVNELR